MDQFHPEIDYASLGDFEFLPCFDLGYPEFETMLAGYNIIEFNTAVKPFYFEYLFRIHSEVDRIYYIDPDILFYQSPELLDREWTGEASIQLTPNLLWLPNRLVRGELASLKHGYNNLGYIGMQRGIETDRIIQWWKERLTTHCKLDKCRGIFVDQKWMDLAPLFFMGIVSVKHPGWNMAWWNLSERKLGKNDQGFYVNDSKIPLVFFHFSGFKPCAITMTERIQSEEFDMESEGALKELFDSYEKQLLANGFETLSKKRPLLKFKEPPNELKHRIGRKLKSKMTNAIFRIFGV